MPAPGASGWSGRRVGLAPTGEAPPCHGARGLRTFARDFCAQILRLARLRVQSLVEVAPLRYDRRAVQPGEAIAALGSCDLAALHYRR